MLTLASMVWAAFAFVEEKTHMRHYPPPPVVIETGEFYKVDEIYSTLYVPSNWSDDCYDQREVVYQMGIYFNSFRNRNKKYSLDFIKHISDQWVCLEDSTH